MNSTTHNNFDIHLEPARPDLVDQIHPFLSDPRLYTFLPDVPPSREELRRRFVSAAREASPQNPNMVWLVRLAMDRRDKVVGIVEIGIFPDGFAEIGFFTFREFQNRGLAKRYCQLAMEEAFRRFPIPGIHASVSDQNLASLKVLGALGFKMIARKTKSERVHGQLCDELIYFRPR